MLKSMTGFGRGEYLGDNYQFKVEIKAVNHRYQEFVIRMPKYMNFLEERIRKKVKEYIARGKIDIYIYLDYLNDSSLVIDVDYPLAKKTYDALSGLNKKLGIKNTVDIDDLTSIVDVITIERKIEDEENLWSELEKALEIALIDIDSMRSIEGQNMQEDMLKRINKIDSILESIVERVPLVEKEFLNKLIKRLEELENIKLKVDDNRLEMELAIFADKSNIDEEIVRLKSHLDQYREIMSQGGSIGRKLDFLVQEMNREVNTIGSKTGDIVISRAVVEIKAEIEKIREQIQNVE